MANTTIPSILPVFIKDEDGRIIPGEKGVKAEVSISAGDYKVIIFVPPVQKKEPTNSTLIFKGENVSITLKSTKDGRVNASGRISKKRVTDVGKEKLVEDFLNAAEKLWKYCE